MTALVEYVLRVRLLEPVAALPAGQVGDAMHALLGEIEAAVVEQEIISRTVLAGPDTPSRVRCAARSLDPSRHYSTSQRWQIKTPNDETIITCSAACALSWLCHEALPADAQEQRQNSAEPRGRGVAA